MRVPSYRRHSSQARVTINGKDHLLGSYGSPQSKEAYGRLIAEYSVCGAPRTFGKVPEDLKMEDLLYVYLQHSRVYYANSSEHANMKTVFKPMTELYADTLVRDFGVSTH